MDEIVSGVLRHLREADIVGLAGLTNASLGQEHYRSGHVSQTKRREDRLSGVVVISSGTSSERRHAIQSEALNASFEPVQRVEVDVEMVSHSLCQATCTCDNQAALICSHAAALLYQWINHPYLFASLSEEDDTIIDQHGNSASTVLKKAPASHEISPRPSEAPISPRYMPLPLQRMSASSVSETLVQFGLSELRALAREYDIALAGMGKQHLVETLIETLGRPEAIRRVVATLEKSQRQLLAALALAGGSMSDEDLRGLFERFALSSAGTLQDMLVALQARLLLVRTSFNHSLQQRFNLSAAPLDISWYIPREIHEALPITVPITHLDVAVPYGKKDTSRLPTLQIAEPRGLLADMLLIARALDGTPVELAEKRSQRGNTPFPPGRVSLDGSLSIPTPEDQPSATMIELLKKTIPRSSAFLRFAVRLLRLAGILYKEEITPARLRILPNAAQLLLGSPPDDVIHELFTHWINQASYAELFELLENGLRVRCRATSLNQPELRRGELEQENKEACQEVIGLLAQVPGEQWVHFSAFTRFIYRLHPTFLQRRQRLFPSPHWWIEHEEGHPLHPSQLSDWLRAESRYLAHLIQGPLYWWGICDLAVSADSQLLGFRLTPVANLLFRGLPTDMSVEQNPEISPPVLGISSDDHVLIPCQPYNWPIIRCIEDFAESTGVLEEKLSYYLTPHSLSEAINQGHDPQDLLTLLKRYSGQEQGSASLDMLTRLEHRIANYGRVRIYTDVSLVQTADTSVMQQLTALISLDEQTICSIHPNLRLLKKQGIERLLEELKRRGQAPLLHEER